MQRRARLFRGGWGPVRRSVVVALWTFGIALLVGLFSGAALTFLPALPAFGLIIIIVLLGIVFDVIGLAAATANEAPFHAKAAKRSPAASKAVAIIRNAEFVSSLCNDLVGDVCGTISGAAAAAILIRLAAVSPGAESGVLSVVVVAGIAAITVGGKAAGKGYALNRANDIIYRVAMVLAGWEQATARLRGVFGRRARPASRRKINPTAKGGRPGGRRPTS